MYLALEQKEKKPHRWECKYCEKRYAKIGKWMIKHFEKKHKNKRMKIKEL